jgi:hypothetical protein
LRDLGRAVLSQVEDFFTNYNRQRGKTFKVTGTSGPRQALSKLTIGIERYESKRKDHEIRADA